MFPVVRVLELNFRGSTKISKYIQNSRDTDSEILACMLQELLIEISEAIISDDTKTDMAKAIEINSLYSDSRDSDKVKIKVYYE